MSGSIVVPGIKLLLNKASPKCGLSAFDSIKIYLTQQLEHNRTSLKYLLFSTFSTIFQIFFKKKEAALKKEEGGTLNLSFFLLGLITCFSFRKLEAIAYSNALKE